MALNRGDTSTNKSPYSFHGGPYIGIVKKNADPTRMGRVEVQIPYFEQRGDVTAGQLFVCDYMTPFYGAKTEEATKNTNRPYGFFESQHSYGMWMTPPDIDTRVLVMFAEGDQKKAFWIGCIMEPYINQMVPGIGASEQTVYDSGGIDDFSDKRQVYGDSQLPAGELNKYAWKDTQVPFEQAKRPVHTPMAETLRKQGLSADRTRGTTTSSARRESPSRVFGISTPGRTKANSRTFPLGPIDEKTQTAVDRLSGHTFVMDDGDVSGDNQLVRLRSSSGHQVLLHDAPRGDKTKSLVYIAHGSGDVWLELSNGGNVDLYAKGSVNIRSSGDMNFHSDNNINMYAGGSIKARAKSGILSMDAQQILSMAEFDNRIQSNGGSVTMRSNKANITSYAAGSQLHMAKGLHNITGTEVHFNSISTSPGLVPPFERTDVLSLNGTGTKTVKYPDVIPSKKENGIFLKVEENKLVGMSGMRVPTHEPYKYHASNITTAAVGTLPSDSKTVGTVGYLADRNRNSKNAIIRYAQFQADLEKYLSTKASEHGDDPIKIKKLAKDFADTYNKDYNILSEGPFSISADAEGVNTLINQTVDSVKGSAVNLLKDQVFLDTGNIVFQEGDLNKRITGIVTGEITNLSVGSLTSTSVGNVLGDVNIPSALKSATNIGNAANQLKNISLNTVTDTVKTTIGGEVTSVFESKSLEGFSFKDTIGKIGRNIGKIFGF